MDEVPQVQKRERTDPLELTAGSLLLDQVVRKIESNSVAQNFGYWGIMTPILPSVPTVFKGSMVSASDIRLYEEGQMYDGNFQLVEICSPNNGRCIRIRHQKQTVELGPKEIIDRYDRAFNNLRELFLLADGGNLDQQREQQILSTYLHLGFSEAELRTVVKNGTNTSFENVSAQDIQVRKEILDATFAIIFPRSQKVRNLAVWGSGQLEDNSTLKVTDLEPDNIGLYTNLLKIAGTVLNVLNRKPNISMNIVASLINNVMFLADGIYFNSKSQLWKYDPNSNTQKDLDFYRNRLPEIIGRLLPRALCLRAFQSRKDGPIVYKNNDPDYKKPIGVKSAILGILGRKRILCPECGLLPYCDRGKLAMGKNFTARRTRSQDYVFGSSVLDRLVGFEKKESSLYFSWSPQNGFASYSIDTLPRVTSVSQRKGAPTGEAVGSPKKTSGGRVVDELDGFVDSLVDSLVKNALGEERGGQLIRDLRNPRTVNGSSNPVEDRALPQQDSTGRNPDLPANALEDDPSKWRTPFGPTPIDFICEARAVVVEDYHYEGSEPRGRYDIEGRINDSIDILGKELEKMGDRMDSLADGKMPDGYVNPFFANLPPNALREEPNGVYSIRGKIPADHPLCSMIDQVIAEMDRKDKKHGELNTVKILVRGKKISLRFYFRKPKPKGPRQMRIVGDADEFTS